MPAVVGLQLGEDPVDVVLDRLLRDEPVSYTHLTLPTTPYV